MDFSRKKPSYKDGVLNPIFLIIGKYFQMLAPVVFVLGGLSTILACYRVGKTDRRVLRFCQESCSRQSCFTPRSLRPESAEDG